MKTTEIKETLGNNGYEIKLTASAASGQRGDEIWIYEEIWALWSTWKTFKWNSSENKCIHKHDRLGYV